jgi:tRNA-splicing ligase RtcB
MVTGNDLVKLGFKPGKWFKEALAHINEHALTGDALVSYCERVSPKVPKMVSLHEKAAQYHVNITADTEVERSNVEAVIKTMETLMRTPTIVNGAVMPDACPVGKVGIIPVGGIAVARNAIHPGMHSADICCSVMLTNLGKVDPKLVLDNAEKVTHFGPGGRGSSNHHRLPIDLLVMIETNRYLCGEKSVRLAQEHLGTQGDGNHFLYVGTLKSTGDTVLVTHHGSRGFGASLYKAGMEVAERFRKQLSKDTPSENAWIPADSIEGQHYWDALQIVRAWTKLNHEVIHNDIVKKSKVDVKDRFWNEHNFVFKDGDLYYHAKGATPVDVKYLPDTNGIQIIPLNMAEPILLVKGQTTRNNLGFAPHGAGRNMSRTQHKNLLGERTVKQVFEDETSGLDVRFYSKLVDISELPSAYKNASEVKRQIAEFGLADIVDEVIPYGCIMAGDQGEPHWKKKKKK